MVCHRAHSGHREEKGKGGEEGGGLVHGGTRKDTDGSEGVGITEEMG